MELEARRERPETSLDSNPRFGPHNITSVLRVLGIMVGVIFFHLTVGVMTRDREAEGAISLALRLMMSQIREALWHMSGSPYEFWPIFSPPTSLFCVVNVRVTNVADWRYTSVAVAANMLQPQLKEISSRQTGVLFDFDPVYSPGWRSNM